MLCHAAAHVEVDECGAPEFFTGGAKLVPLPGADGKIAPAVLQAALGRAGFGVVHSVQPAALTLTQATECGTVYRPNEIRALADLAHDRGLAVHMDGARFANAVVTTGAAPADLTWRAGVDVLSLGATKNGAMAAEAVVFFDRERADRFQFRRKRSGHLFSKMRFLSAQLDAYLADGLWLANAGQANAMASRLAEGLSGLPGSPCSTRSRPTPSSRACPGKRSTRWAKPASASTAGPTRRATSSASSPPSTPRPRTSISSSRRCAAS